MQTSLSKNSIEIIKSTAEYITSRDTDITQAMYKILFSKYPNVQILFANAPKNQYMRLAEILSAYAVNIEKIDRLRPALFVIAKRHVEVGIKPVHYPMIGMVLMQAIEETLQNQATIEFMDAWREAFQVIANILIEMERELYEKEEN